MRPACQPAYLYLARMHRELSIRAHRGKLGQGDRMDDDHMPYTVWMAHPARVGFLGISDLQSLGHDCPIPAFGSTKYDTTSLSYSHVRVLTHISPHTRTHVYV